jgi:hypothetical protein
MSETYPQTRAELLARIERGWQALEQELSRLSHAKLLASDGGEWTLKDHLAHLTAWERSTLAILRGEPRHQALGVDAATYAHGAEAEINHVIFKGNRVRAPADILADLRDTHRRLVEAVERLGDADLQRPDDEFLAGERGDPLVVRIAGNTYEHYDEHLVTIRAAAG